MQTILLVTTLLGVACAIPHPATIDEEWSEYKKSFGKFYTSEREDARRLNAYLETKRRVEEHNRKYERGETSYTMGINKFADWFPEELNRLNGLKIDKNLQSKDAEVFKLPPGVEVPKEIDWVKKGAVTSVKDQGYCGSCYTFSAAGALEGLMYNTNKTITDLSEQELIDCTLSYGNNGCHGGYMTHCFKYVSHRHGLSSNESYPYESNVGDCRASSGKVAASCTSFSVPKTEEDLEAAVGTVGPVSIGFAVSDDFVSYKSGVFNGTCGFYFVNHAMLAVGYGTDQETGMDYWLVKNSWSTGWGIEGYVKILKGVNKCKIATLSSFPTYSDRCQPQNVS